MTDLSLAPTCAPAGWHRTANSTEGSVSQPAHTVGRYSTADDELSHDGTFTV
jgi:hypothetical protein